MLQASLLQSVLIFKNFITTFIILKPIASYEYINILEPKKRARYSKNSKYIWIKRIKKRKNQAIIVRILFISDYSTVTNITDNLLWDEYGYYLEVLYRSIRVLSINRGR